jgi:hypothetical protein
MKYFKTNKDLSSTNVDGYVRRLKVQAVLFWMLFLSVIAMVLSSSTPDAKIVYRNILVHDTIIQEPDIPLTDSAIIEELVKNKCVLAAAALAQMKLESSHFKSKICKENKNIAGIKTSKSKYVKGMLNDHCVYSTYKDCLADYVLIQERYLAKIDGRYAESKNYIKTIRTIK